MKLKQAIVVDFRRGQIQDFQLRKLLKEFQPKVVHSRTVQVERLELRKLIETANSPTVYSARM